MCMMMMVMNPSSESSQIHSHCPHVMKIVEVVFDEDHRHLTSDKLDQVGVEPDPTDPISISVPERKVVVVLRQDRGLDPLLEVLSE